MKTDYSLIGKRVPRVDSLTRVTGEVLFSGDLHFPRMLCAKVKRSPLAHARILNVDTSRAEKLKGVKAVVTARDTAGNVLTVAHTLAIADDEAPVISAWALAQDSGAPAPGQTLRVQANASDNDPSKKTVDGN